MEVAQDQLKSIVQRVERLELEIADLNADKSEIYKEARSFGFDVKAIKKVVSQRKLDTNKREEQDFVFETYWNAVHGLELVHAHARENIEEFDAETGEILEANPHSSAASPSLETAVVNLPDAATDETSRNTGLVANQPEQANETHERPSTNDEPSPEAGPQAEASPAGTGTGTLADREGRHDGEAASAVLPTINERCRNPSGCKFSTHPNKITCSTCASAWLESKKREAA